MSLPVHDPDAPAFTHRYVNMADARLGAVAIEASDDFFADKSRMLNREPAVFIPGKYDTNGKWMDGWESRRKRTAGHDWCVVKLARAGTIHGIDLDTSHFTGNFPPSASLEGCFLSNNVPNDATEWLSIIPPTELQGNSHHYLAVENQKIFTHVRLNIFPDGGIARLRIYGTPYVDWEHLNTDSLIDLAAIENGAHVVAANNQHFGLPINLLMPGRGENMGDGWETRRRREPGNDWCIIALGHLGTVHKITVDTAFFKGNYPDRCSIQAAHITEGTTQSIITSSMFWETLLPEQKLSMDQEHFFEKEILQLATITHIKLNIFPDGGVSRLRLWGVPSRA